LSRNAYSGYAAQARAIASACSLEEHIVAGVALARAAAKWDAEGEPGR